MKAHRCSNILKITLFLCVGLFLVLLVGCGEDEKLHTHTSTYVPRKESTCQAEGNMEYWYCSSCEKSFSNSEMTEELQQENLVLAKKPHQVVVDEAVSPTCGNQGLTEGSHCSICQTVIVAQNEIKALEHSYDYTNVSWTWENFEKAQLILNCTTDQSHTMQFEATIEKKRTEPTCTKAGECIYTASVKMGEKIYRDTRKETLNPTGHDFDLENVIWLWTGTTAKVQLTCKKDNHKEELEAQTKTIIDNPSCLLAGKRTSIATVVVKGQTLTDQKEEILPALGHQFDYEAPLWSWRGTEEAFITLTCSADSSHQEMLPAELQFTSIPATCIETGLMTVIANVQVGDYNYQDQRQIVLPILEHAFDYTKVEFEWSESNALVKLYCENAWNKCHLYAATVTSVRKEPTCLEAGNVSYTASIIINRKKYTDTKVDILPAVGHHWNLDEIEWIWLEDQVYGKVICVEDNVEELIPATLTQKEELATCVKTGTLMTIATISINGQEYKDSMEEILPIHPNAHSLDLSTIEWIWVRSYDSYNAKAVISCGCGSTKQEFTDVEFSKIETPATFTQTGEIKYVASIVLEKKRFTSTFTETLPMKKHVTTTEEFLEWILEESYDLVLEEDMLLSDEVVIDGKYAHIDCNGYTITLADSSLCITAEFAKIENGNISMEIDNPEDSYAITSENQAQILIENITIQGGINIQNAHAILRNVDIMSDTSYILCAQKAAEVILESGILKLNSISDDSHFFWVEASKDTKDLSYEDSSLTIKKDVSLYSSSNTALYDSTLGIEPIFEIELEIKALEIATNLYFV